MAGSPWIPSAVGKPIWLLASGYASDRRRRHPLWMLEAYFDDSGRGNGPAFVLGGFLSTAERWESFNDDWQSVLDRSPPLELFKMKHAMNKWWLPLPAAARMQRLGLFHSAIMKHAQMGFVCVINHDAFDRLVRLGLGFTDTIYQLAFTGVIATTIRYHREMALTDKIDFVFDEQPHEFPRALRSFLNIWESDNYLNMYLAGTPRSANDVKVLPLQAADYIAWQIRRKIEQDQFPDKAIRRLAITSEAEGSVMETGDIPIMIDVWDDVRLRELGRDVVRERIESLGNMNFPLNMHASVHEILVAKLRDFL